MDWKYSYQVRQALVPFCNLIALMLGYSSAKYLRVAKIVKQITFERVWDKLASKKCFRRQSFTKYLRPTLVFK